MRVTRDQLLTFQKNLVKERLSRDITQIELADAIGITQGHLSYIEHGKRELTPERYNRIVEYFKVKEEML